MGERKGLFGKLMDAVTSDKGERQERARKGEKHGGLLGMIEDQVMPDTPDEKRAKAAKKGR